MVLIQFDLSIFVLCRYFLKEKEAHNIWTTVTLGNKIDTDEHSIRAEQFRFGFDEENEHPEQRTDKDEGN